MFAQAFYIIPTFDQPGYSQIKDIKPIIKIFPYLVFMHQ